MTFVYLLSFEVPYEGSTFVGIFSTMRLAKDEAERASDTALIWSGNRRLADATARYGHYEVTKIRVDESAYKT